MAPFENARTFLLAQHLPPYQDRDQPSFAGGRPQQVLLALRARGMTRIELQNSPDNGFKMEIAASWLWTDHAQRKREFAALRAVVGRTRGDVVMKIT